jgi:hypothetical protein
MHRLLPWVTALLSAGPALGQAGSLAPPTVPVHGRFEASFLAMKDADPDTDVQIEYTAPGGKTFTVPAYWDGGRVWKARFRPDEPGMWGYRARSKPPVPGLDLGAGGGFAAVAEKSDNRFLKHGPIRVAKSGTYLEHADGTPFFFLADTCWTGPALSTPEDWQTYLKDRAGKKFTAVQFNMASPWRTAPTDAEGRTAYTTDGGKFRINPEFYKRVDARTDAINAAGLLAVPVLCWAHKKRDAGDELTEEQIIKLVRYEVARYGAHHVLWVLAGDNRYTPPEAEKWKRIGLAVFGDHPSAPVTTHPTGRNFPWADWEDEEWLTVLGYQSGHGDAPGDWMWLHSGPPAEYGKRKEFTRPVINLEPPYEAHNGYTTHKPHSDLATRRAVYWSLLVHPPAGVTYGGHGVWSWHTKPGVEPTDHKGTGVVPKTWREAIDLPGAKQMGYVHELFESLPWTILRPESEVYAQVTGKDDPSKFVACAAGEDKGQAVYVFYFPPGATADIGLHVRGGADRIRWFNPRSGEWPGKSGRGLFTPPDEQDWVLVVKP